MKPHRHLIYEAVVFILHHQRSNHAYKYISSGSGILQNEHCVVKKSDVLAEARTVTASEQGRQIPYVSLIKT